MLEITGNADKQEAQAYIDYLEKKYNRKVHKLNVKIDGDYVDLNYTFYPEPFERIRRITGYLVGDMSHWNDAKSKEEADRVKHDTSAASFGSDLAISEEDKKVETDKRPSLDEQLARAAEKVAQQNNTVSHGRRQREER